MANSTAVLLASYQKNKMMVWGIVAVLAMSVYFYFMGKKDGKTRISDAPYIDGKNGIPKGYNPNILADKLYSVMNDLFTLTGTKDNIFKELLQLGSDDMVIAVYNAYNDKYGIKGHGTLTQWIEDEKYYDFLSGVKQKTLDRLAKLRLT